MRLEDMSRRHPNQDNSKVCSLCGHKVGIYPSGQAILKDYPKFRIVCHVCVVKLPRPNVQAFAPGALQEPSESYDVKKRH
jgi:hypothetical protein